MIGIGKDAAQAFAPYTTTLNGVRARGGSMNGPAPVVAGGMVYVSSGYGTFGLRPGNVLLAFAP